MDNQIIELLKNKDDYGLELLQMYYGQFINYILCSLRLNQQDREECHNDIVLKIWDKIEQYDETQITFKNYIAMISRRQGLNYVRKNKKLLKEIQYEQMDLFKDIQDVEKIDWKYVVSKLSYKEQEFFYRRYYYYQTLDEISKERAMTYKAVENSYYRLRKKLRKILQGEGYYE